MITVYKVKAIPKGMEKVVLNDTFFNQKTAELLDERAAEIIATIDHSQMDGKYSILSRFDGSKLNIDKLSTGCKTALNILYNPDKVFDIRECGDNALDVIYTFEKGNICCDYPLISFDMTEVFARDKKETRTFDSYEELKEWWSHES